MQMQSTLSQLPSSKLGYLYGIIQETKKVVNIDLCAYQKSIHKADELFNRLSM